MTPVRRPLASPPVKRALVVVNEQVAGSELRDALLAHLDMAVTTAETSSEPPQPSLLEKKMNMILLGVSGTTLAPPARRAHERDTPHRLSGRV